MVDKTTFSVNGSNLTMRIQQAEMYLKEFEDEVRRAQGATGMFRSKEDALSRVMILNEFAPDDPRVQALFNRAKACVMGSTGNFTTITDEMTQYLVNEENIRRLYSEKSAAAWKKAKAEHADEMIDRVFPAPDFSAVSFEEYIGKYVVLDDVRYPMNQFMGITGEFVHVGKRSTGMYFVKLDTRKWVGPYEAVKRYRRLVDATMAEVDAWTVLGRIADMTMEVPESGEETVGAPLFAAVVEPVALYVPGHVVAFYSEDKETSG